MIGREERLQDHRPASQQWLSRIDAPVERHVDDIAILLQGPDASALEVTRGDNRKTGRVLGPHDLEIPVQRVREPAACVETHASANAVRSLSGELRRGQVDGRPPAWKIERLVEHVGDFFDRCGDAPVSREVVVAGRQSLNSMAGKNGGAPRTTARPACSRSMNVYRHLRLTCPRISPPGNIDECTLT
jgi:hypothetical protein